jgi:hypothetical protein
VPLGGVCRSVVDYVINTVLPIIIVLGRLVMAHSNTETTSNFHIMHTPDKPSHGSEARPPFEVLGGFAYLLVRQLLSDAG